MQGLKALLLMGGQGERFGSSVPKQFISLVGKKTYLHTLEKLLDSRLFEEIILVCHPEWQKIVKEEIHPFTLQTTIQVIEGGKTRQESSYLGLLACESTTQFVVIHDAVRPFVSERILRDNVQAVTSWLAVDTCISSSDTLVRVGPTQTILSIPKRSDYMRGQTPQSFSYPLILEAHQRANEKNLKDISDDCRLILEMGKEVFIVQGEEKNLKITTELDFFFAEQFLHHLLNSQEEILRLDGLEPSTPSLKVRCSTD